MLSSRPAYRVCMAAGRSQHPAELGANGLNGPVRVSLILFGVLALGGFGALYVLSNTTDRSFAWTIRPSVTAGFLGAGYLAGLAGVGYSLWCRVWRQIRLWLVGFFVFSTVTAVATALHLEQFHFGSGGLAEVAAWTWIAVYVALPPWTLALVIAVGKPGQGRREVDLPGWPFLLVVILWVQTAMLTAVGVGLFVAPASAEWLWPWELGPLSARAVAAWLLASATLAGLMASQRRPASVGVSAAAYMVLPLAFGVALPRFAGQLEWGRPAAPVFLVVLVAMVATGLAGVLQSRRHTRS